MKSLTQNEMLNVFQNLGEGIVIHSSDTSIKYFNESALKILNLTAEQLLTKNAQKPEWFFIDQDGNQLEYNQFPVIKVLESQKEMQNYFIGVEKLKENTIWLNVNGVPIFNNGKIESVVISFIDISKQIQALNLAHHKTYFHPLTTLPNLTMLDKKLEELKKEEQHVLILTQIECYNNLHQYFGNEIAKDIISFIVSILRRYFTKEYQLFHVEIDKFAIVLNRKWDISKIDRILKHLNEFELFFQKIGLHIQLVSGISFEENDKYLTAKAALIKSMKDQEIYQIYSQKNNLSFEINNDIFWAEALRKVIKLNGLVPVFQPIVDNKTLKVEKYEVLMRLELDNEIYSPAVFLDVSKRVNLYKSLTKSLIEKVFQYFEDKKIPFSINLNTEDLMCDSLTDGLLYKIQNFHTPSNVTIEIVESEGIGNFKRVNRFLNRLKVYGCKVAIDDFGSGYSNFEYILKLDADYIKIDGSLIKEINDNQDSYDIVQTIVSFAKLKKIKVIAEYVSSKEIFETIKKMGIEYSQGFYFGKPKLQVSKIDTSLIKESLKKTNKEENIKQVIYASEVNNGINIEELKKTFKEAAVNNLQNDISGFIIFDKQYFLQIIEGTEVIVNNLYEKIVNDQRHKNILLLGVRVQNKRDFRDWNLGYIDEDQVIDDYLYKKTNKNKFLPAQFEYDFALEFLKEIRTII